jgi:hypothetical protein
MGEEEDACFIVDEGGASGGSFGKEPVKLSGEGASHVRHHRCSFTRANLSQGEKGHWVLSAQAQRIMRADE